MSNATGGQYNIPRRGSVYLCGPIAGMSFQEAKFGWRYRVFAALQRDGIDAFSPLRHLQATQLDDDHIDHMGKHGASAGALSTPKGLTVRDRYDTKRADLIFCNLLGAHSVSIGSMIELGWADAANVPIILIMEEEGNIHEHAMVETLASWTVPTVKDGIQIVQDLLIPGV
jgi:nucleoside 2-deoxyribosyltransferase